MLSTNHPKTENGLTPAHIAIIMDGNGRWAEQRGLPRIAGHKKGAESVKEAIDGCIENNISYLTLYAFSSENWTRPTQEVDSLMELLHFYLGKELKKLHKNGVCLKVIGDRSKLAENIRQKITEAEELTKDNKRLCLVVALSYGGRQEIIHAARKIAEKAADGSIDVQNIDEAVFGGELYTAGIPDPDILIRTSGEQRLSNFLLWQMAYTELFFINILWPDFKKHNIMEVISQFQKRERRYGNS